MKMILKCLLVILFCIDNVTMEKQTIKSILSKMELSPVKLLTDQEDFLEFINGELPFGLLNPDEVDHGKRVIYGDIVVTALENEQMFENSNKKSREKEYRKTSQNIWPDDYKTGLPTIPFKMGSSVILPDRVRDAIDHIESLTCIRFKEYFDFFPAVNSYVEFVANTGCWSSVGYISNYKQKVSLGRGCYSAGIILHELCHVLGLYHEHSRVDKNQHIKLNYSNVAPNREGNFDTFQTETHDIPYDISSLMQYDSTEFSVDGRSTIMTLDPRQTIYLGQRRYLTFRDLAAINNMYKCPERWHRVCGSNQPQCDNGGYIGQNCSCMCPPGTGSPTCQITTGQYYPTPTCGGNITQDGHVITSPNFPNNYPKFSSCLWWIQSNKSCVIPQLTFLNFSLFIRGSNKQCIWDRLEIRTQDIYYGDEYCETDIPEGQIIKAKGQDLILFFSSKLNWDNGFKAVVNFVTDPLCSFSSKCTQTYLEDKIIWSGDQYSSGNSCNITITSQNKPLKILMKVVTPLLDEFCSDDTFSIESVSGNTQNICNLQKYASVQLVGSIHFGYFKHQMKTKQIEDSIWEVEFESLVSNCHKEIVLTPESPSEILRTTNYPRYYSKGDTCEWWIKAPEGYQIELKFVKLVLGSKKYRYRNKYYRKRYYQKYCNRGYVLISHNGDPMYPEESSTKLCGFREPGFIIKSSINSSSLALLFWGTDYQTKGFKLKINLLKY